MALKAISVSQLSSATLLPLRSFFPSVTNHYLSSPLTNVSVRPLQTPVLTSSPTSQKLSKKRAKTSSRLPIIAASGHHTFALPSLKPFIDPSLNMAFSTFLASTQMPGQ